MSEEEKQKDRTWAVVQTQLHNHHPCDGAFMSARDMARLSTLRERFPGLLGCTGPPLFLPDTESSRAECDPISFNVAKHFRSMNQDALANKSEQNGIGTQAEGTLGEGGGGEGGAGAGAGGGGGGEAASDTVEQVMWHIT